MLHSPFGAQTRKPIKYRLIQQHYWRQCLCTAELNIQLLFFVNVKLYMKSKLKKATLWLHACCQLSLHWKLHFILMLAATSITHSTSHYLVSGWKLSFILEFMYSCRKESNKVPSRPLCCSCQRSTFTHEPSLIIFVQVFHNLSVSIWRYFRHIAPTTILFLQKAHSLNRAIVTLRKFQCYGVVKCPSWQCGQVVPQSICLLKMWIEVFRL